MPLSCDLHLLINDYLDHGTRRALTRVSPIFDTVHHNWSIYQAQSLLRRCPFLGYLGLTKLTTMLRSPVTVTFDPVLRSTQFIDYLFHYYNDAIVNDKSTRAQIETTLQNLIHRRAVQRIPNCHPLFIMVYSDKLIVLDENLNLYLDGQQVLSGITDISFHGGHLTRIILTQQGEAYVCPLKHESEMKRICQTGFINHHSGLYHVHDDYYLSDNDGLDVKVSDDPIVLLCHGDFTCLITSVSADAVRTSFILKVSDIEITSRFSVTTVRMAVDIKLGYIVLLDDGSCAILLEDVYENLIVQDTTYDHITRCEYDLIVARRGDKIYRLNVEDDRVIEEESIGFFPAPERNGVYKLSY